MIPTAFTAFDIEEQRRAVDNALQYAREVKQRNQDDLHYYVAQQENVIKSQLEWHRKFTLSFACFIFFFIGAPLGAIIRKGGLGMPVVVSVLLFIIYYIISMMGERSAREAVISPAAGMWISAFILLPLGIILTYKSVTDSEMMNTEAYTAESVHEIDCLYRKEEKCQVISCVSSIWVLPILLSCPLKRIIEAGFQVVGVVTNPDKPAGRGQQLQESAVKKYAREIGLKILQPEKFRDPDFLQALAELKADLQFVVAFKMLPEVVWNMPPLGTVNLHASLLPDYRGAAPINRAVMNGETCSGVTTFLFKAGDRYRQYYFSGKGGNRRGDDRRRIA